MIIFESFISMVLFLFYIKLYILNIHIVVLSIWILRFHFQSQPGDKYLGFLVDNEGTGLSVALGLLKYLEEFKITIDNLECVGCDGTSVNTGWKVINYSIITNRQSYLTNKNI